MKLIYLLGEPGSGKTSLLKAVFKDTNIDFQGTNYLIELNGTMKLGTIDEKNKVIILGFYDGDKPFTGTDLLSMSVQPKMLEKLKSMKDSDYVVVAEGDRLANNSFFGACEEFLDTCWIALCVDQKIGQERREKRAKENNLELQDQQWLNGRKTKVNNIVGARDVVLKFNNSVEETGDVTHLIKGLLQNDQNLWDQHKTKKKQSLEDMFG